MCENLFTKKEAEVLLGVSSLQIEEFLRKGSLHHRLQNGRVRISQNSIERFKRGGNRELSKNVMAS